MDNKLIIQKTQEHVKNVLEGEGSGHDWWHIYRVWKTANHIGEKEKADLLIVQLAALLHDISDWKFNDGNDDIGPQKAREWLESLNVQEEIIGNVCSIIKEMPFKGSKTSSVMKTIEGKIVQDADRLDAIGAIGIGRTFAYGGHKGREMYNPEIKVEHHESFEQYKNNKSPTINHFYEKLLLLKDRMNTKTAKEMAEGRHKVMEEFLERFFNEWEGKE
jgi:uncharacterized protein